MTPDTPDAVTTAMVREQRDLLDAQPMHFTFVADDLANGETYLVDLDNHGAVLVKRIGFTQNEHMAFSPGAFMAIAEAAAAWNLAIHEWKQHQAFVKAQKAAEEATKPWTKADLPSAEGLPAIFDGPTQDQRVVDLPAGEPAFQDENGLPIPF